MCNLYSIFFKIDGVKSYFQILGEGSQEELDPAKRGFRLILEKALVILRRKK